MTDETTKPRTWCLEPDFEGRDGDSDEIYWGYALNYNPHQGPLNIQAHRVMVVEKSAYDALKAKCEYLEAARSQHFAQAMENGCAANQWRTQAEKLAAALRWYWEHWNANSRDVKERGYHVSKDALADYQAFKEKNK